MEDQKLSTAHAELSLEGLIEERDEYIQRAKSAATSRAYRTDWRDFTKWALDHGLKSLPADPETVALYITDLASRVVVSTIQRRLTAITKAHLAANYPDSPASTHHFIVGETLRGIRRTLGIAQKGKDPLLSSHIRCLLEACPTRLDGLRDSALLLVGFAGAFRRSEIASLKVADFAFCPEGMVITLHSSKSDQEGAGRKVAIPFGREEGTCPVRALHRWLEAASIESGPVFRAVSARGLVSRRALSRDSVGWLIKRAARRAGMKVDTLSGHSLRAGHVTQAVRGGVPELIIMRQTGHKSVMTLRKYVREGELFTLNPVPGLGL